MNYAMVVRHIAVWGGEYLVGAGVITGVNEQDHFVSAVMTIAGVVWAAYQKYEAHKAIKAVTPAATK